MAEYGNAIAMPTIGMSLEVDPEVRRNTELALVLNYAKTQEAYPELLGHSYEIKEGPPWPLFERYEIDPETGDSVGVGNIIGFERGLAWYVNTEVSDAAH